MTGLPTQEIDNFLDRIESLEMENARLKEENMILKELMLSAWEWVGVKAKAPLPLRYRQMMKEFAVVIRDYRKDKENKGE